MGEWENTKKSPIHEHSEYVILGEERIYEVC